VAEAAGLSSGGPSAFALFHPVCGARRMIGACWMDVEAVPAGRWAPAAMELN